MKRIVNIILTLCIVASMLAGVSLNAIFRTGGGKGHNTLVPRMDPVGCITRSSDIDVVNGNGTGGISLEILEAEPQTFDNIRTLECCRNRDRQGLECSVRQGIALANIVLRIMDILFGIIVLHNKGRFFPLGNHTVLGFEPDLQNIAVFRHKAEGEIGICGSARGLSVGIGGLDPGTVGQIPVGGASAVPCCNIYSKSSCSIVNGVALG